MLLWPAAREKRIRGYVHKQRRDVGQTVDSLKAGDDELDHGQDCVVKWKTLKNMGRVMVERDVK